MKHRRKVCHVWQRVKGNEIIEDDHYVVQGSAVGRQGRKGVKILQIGHHRRVGHEMAVNCCRLEVHPYLRSLACKTSRVEQRLKGC